MRNTASSQPTLSRGNPGLKPRESRGFDLSFEFYPKDGVISAALFQRLRTGQGQYIDLALLDTQVAWLANQNLNYLVSGTPPRRQGTAHPNIVPYQAFATADGHLMLAVGNDAQFARFCTVAGAPAVGRAVRSGAEKLPRMRKLRSPRSR